MTEAIAFSAFRDDGRLVRLEDLLAKVPENNFVWSIIEFCGIGEAPQKLSMDSFEALVRSKRCGLIMSWDKIKRFAERLDQTIDCTIIAVKTESRLLDFVNNEQDVSPCEIVLRAFDSTSWLVWARDERLMSGFEKEAKGTEKIKSTP
jgi:hypothetical protein